MSINENQYFIQEDFLRELNSVFEKMNFMIGFQLKRFSNFLWIKISKKYTKATKIYITSRLNILITSTLNCSKMSKVILIGSPHG